MQESEFTGSVKKVQEKAAAERKKHRNIAHFAGLRKMRAHEKIRPGKMGA
jgi:hypothetical protein